MIWKAYQCERPSLNFSNARQRLFSDRWSQFVQTRANAISLIIIQAYRAVSAILTHVKEYLSHLYDQLIQSSISLNIANAYFFAVVWLRWVCRYMRMAQHMEHYKILKLKMEKVSWRQVKQNDKAGNFPNLRWGHCCCLIDDQVLFFGGYADSSYMNDVWSFNTITMEWAEIETKGDIPSHRSNCTMNYDRENNRVIVFGGGGANKKRFNTLNILDWKTKEWIEVNPRDNEAAPWERTYHTAELFYPYLVVYGGEGVSDLDDLWVFNFMTMGWTEVPIPKGATKPSARRFHASAKIGNEFFVIAGCYSKYRCLSDIYSIDLTSFFETGRVDNLAWKERKMKDNTFLTRWGHTASVYEGKIYVFGGRFCNDLNDILILDSAKEQVTTLKVQGDIPKARRRHSACFLGSSLLIFGGFNGEYFNDLHYINIPSAKRRVSLNLNLAEKSVRALEKVKAVEYVTLRPKEGSELAVCKGLIAPRFASIQSLQNFITEIDQKLQVQQLKQLIDILYKGFGKADQSLVLNYGINVCQTKQQLQSALIRSICPQKNQCITEKTRKNVQPVILLEDHQFRQFIQKKRNQQHYFDVVFNINNQEFIKANRSLLALNSHYFRILLSYHYRQNQQVLNIPCSDAALFQTLIYYLTTGLLVCSKSYGHEYWVILAEMAEYYSVDGLLNICQSQLLARITENTAHELLLVALQANMSQLAKACAEQIIRKMVNQEKQEAGELFPEVKSEFLSYHREKVLKQIYNLLRFDILQKKIDSQQKVGRSSLKGTEDKQSQEEKQNFETRT